jgi:hypothetical protein
MEELNNLRHYMLDLTAEYGTPHNNQKRNLWNAYYALEAKIKQLELTAVGNRRELLIAYEKKRSETILTGDTNEEIVDQIICNL